MGGPMSGRETSLKLHARSWNLFPGPRVRVDTTRPPTLPKKKLDKKDQLSNPNPTSQIHHLGQDKNLGEKDQLTNS